jgi:choline kinase
LAVSAALPAIYLAAGEGKRLRPLTADRPKAMIEIDGVPLAERALRSLRDAGIEEVVAITGYRADAIDSLGNLVSEARFNPRFADAENVVSLWHARDVVARGCYIVNSDVLFEDEVARRLVEADGSALLCAADHGVDEESMKAVAPHGNLEQLTKDVPPDSGPEYVGLTRVDPEHGPDLARILEEMVGAGTVNVYYEAALEELAQARPIGIVSVDGLAWIEIDDHPDLARARDDVLPRVR